MTAQKAKKGLPWQMLPVILSLALPTMLEQLLNTAVQYVDTAMVGSLGTAAVAAVGSTTTVNWLVGSTVSAVGVGFLAYIARACGAGKLEKAKAASAQAVLCVLVIGLLFTLITLLISPFVPALMQVDPDVSPLASRYFFIIYTPMLFRCASMILGTVLRAAGDTKTPMLVGLFVNAVNVVLNWFLIFPTRYISLFSLKIFMPGAGWGVEGAAIASAISFVAGGICIFIALWRHPQISPKGYSVKPDKEVLAPCFRVAFPNSLQRFGTSLGYVVFASMVNSVGGVATAAHTVANTVESAFYIPGYGMQTAGATLAGNCYGANDRKKLNDIAKMMLIIEVFLMLISGTLLFLLSPYIVRLFASEKAVILLAVTVLRMVALSEPFYGVSIIIEGMMQGMGKTVMPFVSNLVCMWCVRIVGTFICTQILSLGLVSAWACMIAHNLVLFVLFVIMYASGRWAGNMGHHAKRCE